jgi:hypothetical protein
MGTRAHTVPKFYLRGFVAPDSERQRDPYVWLASVKTDEVARKSPKNVSIARGIYDGPGGFAEPDKSIEAHLAKIESEAAGALKRMGSAGSSGVPPQVWRFLAWQAARTPGWMKLEQEWVNQQWDGEVVEPPPDGVDNIKDRQRPLHYENLKTGEVRYTDNKLEQEELQRGGWTLKLGRDDHLELLHMQAWYFQVRHFPRLSWVQLIAPDGEFFITSDRGVAWLVDGYADTPPAALRHPAAQIVAPLTRKIALVGRHETAPLNVTPREVNRFIAFASNDWVAGPTREVVERALSDRRDSRH